MKLSLTGYLVITIAVLLGTNGYTLKKWLSADANCQSAVNTKAAGVMGKDIAGANKAQAEAFDKGEKAKSEVEQIFVPMKETIRETRYVASPGCTGQLPDRVQDAVRSAVDAANAG